VDQIKAQNVLQLTLELLALQIQVDHEPSRFHHRQVMTLEYQRRRET
jgi:hypothetical protein